MDKNLTRDEKINIVTRYLLETDDTTYELTRDAVLFLPKDDFNMLLESARNYFEE
mgnify:CR=1 FL=1